MSDLQFVDQHNMVAYLERTNENAEFHQIVDFLTSSTIHYALTAVYTGEDDRVVRAATTAASLEANGPPKKVGDKAVYTREDDRVVRAATTAASLEAEFEIVSKQSHDLRLSEVNTFGSGEDSMEHQDDLTDFVPPTPYDSPLSGGHTPKSDEDCSRLGDQKVEKESQKIGKEANGKNSRDEALHLSQEDSCLRTIQDCSRLGDQKVEKESQKIGKEANGKNSRDEALQDWSSIYLTKKVVKLKTLITLLRLKRMANVAEPISTNGDAVNAASAIPGVSVAGPSTSAIGPSTSTAEDIFEDKMTTMADTLMAIRRTRPRTTSVVIHDVEKEPRRATPPPIVQSYKGSDSKGFKDSLKIFKKEQAQFEREQRTAREKAAE
nr:hypothetical protein [Tanacetum cinerariifolium]